MMWDVAMIKLTIMGIGETLYITLISTLLAYAVGIPIGIGLVVTEKEGLLTNTWLYSLLNMGVNIIRSISFLILLVVVIPFARFVVGNSIGLIATIIPLSVAAVPYIARMIEGSLKEIDSGIIEAAVSMGASPLQIIMKVMLLGAKPSLLIGAATSVTTILGYAAMISFIGGGGIGNIAITYVYSSYKLDFLLITLMIVIAVVQTIQGISIKIARQQDQRK